MAMAVLILHCTLILTIFTFSSLHFHPAASETVPVPVPSFVFDWFNDKGTFQAGETATVKIKILGNFESIENRTTFSPFLSVNGKVGNSSFISGVRSVFGNDTEDWRLLFVPIMTGLFSLTITENRFSVLDSSLHFTVMPGKMYPSVSLVSWKGLVNEFVAGTKAEILLLPRDAFGNNISTISQEPNASIFKLSAFYDNSSTAEIRDVTYMGWNKVGYVSIEFTVAAAGNLSLLVEGGDQTLNGSPLPFQVSPGLLDVSSCLAKAKFESKVLQIFSKLEIYIHQHDQYGNLVQGLHDFDAEVVEKGTNLSIPVPDLHFKEVAPGIQLFSFDVLEPGTFVLLIYDMKQNRSISNMPYEYTVFVGYCDTATSIVNGTGLNSSSAGETAKFSVYLKDRYQYPSPVELEKLRVQIVRKNDSLLVSPAIHPMQTVNRSGPPGVRGTFDDMKIAYESAVGLNNTPVGELKVHASAFDVIFTPLKSGDYDILVFCGNVPLNEGRSFLKEVKPGKVNASLSSVVEFSPKVPKLVQNEITVLLVDSFNNPVSSQQSGLKLETSSSNSSVFSSWVFVDNKNGSYSGQYVIKEAGTYELCVSFDDKRFSPCPLGVNVYSGDYFPKANDDSVSVWEDESISFNVLENDYFATGNASIAEYTKPSHGSLLQDGQLFRYTPYKDFYGSDNFSYTISDVNGNLAIGSVNISVLITPPQFVSFPSQLIATEGLISPESGGFSGFEIRYSDLMENISVKVSAKSGSVFLSPMLMQFWQPMWNAFSVENGEKEIKDLTLEGPVEVLNFAIQSIQYFGKEDFYGNDVIQISTINRSGNNSLEVPVFVLAVNDPPSINVPEFIILKKGDDDALKIFDRERHKFEFSIGDPDLPNFPGGESRFIVLFALEVDSGILITHLPVELVNTTELKLQDTYEWQPLQTFVTISRRFMVKAKGVRFRGTIGQCNTVMQELFYDGDEEGAVLTVTVNDMGYYGQYPGSIENVSMPLFAEATVNLIRRGPMSSLVSHGLGSVIVVEFLLVLSLGMLLLFFTCKCAFLLRDGRRNRRLSTAQNT